ncbi:MAG: hypothetical protein IT353_11995 [Gemmatimonadaceae bacterium]|nr:hypothetical protein [Gemmatimonadaceae bacterium]
MSSGNIQSTPGRAGSGVAIAAALTLAVLCAGPLVLWGNPYPPQATSYWAQGLAAACAVAALAAALRAKAVTAAAHRLGNLVSAVPSLLFGLVLFVGSTAIAATIAIQVFRRGVTTTDELAQLWHAKVLLSGRLTLPVDADPEFFSLDTIVDAGQWFSQFPIGGPLLLAIGSALGAPWLVNPILTGLSVVACYQFARRAYDEPTGRLVGAISALAPSVLIMGATMMNHPAVLCLVMWTLVSVQSWALATSRASALRSALCVGLLLGIMATIRPLDAVVAAIVIGVFQLVRLRETPVAIWDLGVQTVGGLVGAAPLLIANARTTGSALKFAYEQQWGAGHGLGFHVDPYGHLYTPREGIERAMTYVGELNMYVTAWPMPAIVLMIVALVVLRRVLTRWDYLLLALFFAQVVAYAAYWGNGELLGPRFLFSVLPVIVVLIARFVRHLSTNPQSATLRRAAIGFFASCVVLTWCVPSLPLNAWGLLRAATSARQSLRIDINEATRRAGISRGLVLLREPFAARLTRRLWGAGLSRSATAIALSRKDGCALLDLAVTAESGAIDAPSLRASVDQLSDVGDGDMVMETADGLVQFTSPASFTPRCKTEVDSDEDGGFVPFGLALPHQQFDAQGVLTGDIIYAADLGDHNIALRARFGDRPWYRLVSTRDASGVTVGTLVPLP